MKKKVFLSILVMICFLFGINSVKAEEGENKIGEKTTFAKYCDKGECYYLVFDKELDEIRVFHGDGKTEKKNNLISKFTNLCYEDCVQFIVDSHQVPNKYLYYASIVYDHGIAEVHEEIFAFMTGNISKEEFANILRNSEGNIDTKKFELVYYYGSDSIDIDDDYVPYKVDELEEKTKEINGGKIEYDDGTAGCGILTPAIKNKINWVLDFIKYAGTALAIILGAADFLKATLADDDAASKKAFQKFINRLIAAVLLFLIPLIIQFLFTAIDNPLIQIPGFNKDEPTCGIGVSENK